jgi:hypothetical protein
MSRKFYKCLRPTCGHRCDVNDDDKARGHFTLPLLEWECECKASVSYPGYWKCVSACKSEDTSTSDYYIPTDLDNRSTSAVL